MWQSLLSGETTYKVGHRGSLNATPKSLWRLWFPKGSSTPISGKRMLAMLSTIAGKHGDEDSGTEVPRRKLLSALQSHTRLRNTQGLHGSHDPKGPPHVDEVLPL